MVRKIKHPVRPKSKPKYGGLTGTMVNHARKIRAENVKARNEYYDSIRKRRAANSKPHYLEKV